MNVFIGIAPAVHRSHDMLCRQGRMHPKVALFANRAFYGGHLIPVGLGVSCSADRNIKCKINKEGIWIEKLDSNPGELIPVELRQAGEGDVVKIDLNRPMSEILKELTKYPVATRLSLNGTIIVGRDISHAKLKERLDRGEDLPQYIKDHPIYYAGPAKTPEGMACGSTVRPTTSKVVFMRLIF